MKFALISALILSTVAFAQPQTTPPAPPAAPAPRIRVAPRVAPRVMVMGDMSGSYLGVDIDEVTSDRVAALKLKEERGVEVTMVDQDAPAAKAGLKEHDVITEFNGQRVEGREQFTRFIRETPAGRTVTLGIVRDGQPMQIKAILADRKEAMKNAYKYSYKYNDRMIHIPPPEMPDMPDFDIEIPQMEFSNVVSSSTGVSIDNLTPQLAQYFGVKAGQGVLVKNVEKGSPAEKAGLKAGDVIVKVNNESIENRSDYRQAIRHRDGDSVKIVVIRNKAEQTLTMNLPSPRKNNSRRVLPNGFDVQFDKDFDDDNDSDFFEISNAFQYEMPRIEVDMNGIAQIVTNSVSDAVKHIKVDPKVVVDADCATTY